MIRRKNLFWNVLNSELIRKETLSHGILHLLYLAFPVKYDTSFFSYLGIFHLPDIQDHYFLSYSSEQTSALRPQIWGALCALYPSSVTKDCCSPRGFPGYPASSFLLHWMLRLPKPWASHKSLYPTACPRPGTSFFPEASLAQIVTAAHRVPAILPGSPDTLPGSQWSSHCQTSCCLYGWIDGWLGGWVFGCMEGGLLDGWMDG